MWSQKIRNKLAGAFNTMSKLCLTSDIKKTSHFPPFISRRTPTPVVGHSLGLFSSDCIQDYFENIDPQNYITVRPWS